MRRLSISCVWIALTIPGLTAALAQTPGLVPLNDLGTGSYLGFTGGLYPGGANVPPLAHLDRALVTAADIEPLDASGGTDADGSIVLLAIGMSNTNQEFAVFERQEDALGDRNARVVLVDGAVGGQDAVTISNPLASYWTVVDQRLVAMGLTAQQVQVVWLKEEVQGPVPAFPLDAMNLRGYLESIVQILHDRFPQLRLCYLSSRIYGGWGGGGEPKAYESGFAVKWLIEDQIDGDPAVNDGRLPGPIEAPLLLWGPYLWANGPTPRSDGLTWLSADLESDNTHPSPTGEQKVANLLSSFFDSDVTAAAWWPRRSDAALVALDAVRDSHVSAVSPSTNFGSVPTLLVQGGAQAARAYLGFVLPVLGAPVEHAKLSLRVPTDGAGGGAVARVSDTTWTESGITWSNAPSSGPNLVSVPQISRDGIFAAAVTADVNSDGDGALTYAIASGAMGAREYHARESGQAPRLVVGFSCAGGGPPAMADADSDGVRDACDCEPTDPTLLVAPPEVSGLHWSSATDLAWDSLTSVSGSATVYDVMSGDLDEVGSLWTGAGDSCVSLGAAATTVSDTTSGPAPGEGHYFLVRARNACGTGRWATTSDGRDRLTTACSF